MLGHFEMHSIRSDTGPSSRPDGLHRLVDFMDKRSIRVRDLNREYFRKRDEDSTRRHTDEH
jgi:hypothetical protein